MVKKGQYDDGNLFPEPDLPQVDPLTALLDIGGMTQDLQVLCTPGNFQIGSYVTAYLDVDDVHGVPYVVTPDNQHWETFPASIPRELIGNGSHCVYYKWFKPDWHGNPPAPSYPMPISAYNSPDNPLGLTLVISSVTDNQPPNSNDVASVQVLQGAGYYQERVQLSLPDSAQFVPDGGQTLTVKTGAIGVQVKFTSVESGTVRLWGNLIDHPDVQAHRDYTFGSGAVTVKIDCQVHKVPFGEKVAIMVVLMLEYVNGGAFHKVAQIDVSVQTSDGRPAENVAMYRDGGFQKPCFYVLTGDQGQSAVYLATNLDLADFEENYKLTATPRLEGAVGSLIPVRFADPRAIEDKGGEHG